MAATKKPARSTAKTEKSYGGFTEDERAAMKDYAQELKTSARRRTGADKTDPETDLLEKIAAMQESDRVIAERIHAIIKESLPELTSRTWYGMPAYAKDGETICFFQPAQKFKQRFATLGFSDKANLDDGSMWPIYYAVPKLTPENEARIAELIKQAAS